MLMLLVPEGARRQRPQDRVRSVTFVHVKG